MTIASVSALDAKVLVGYSAKTLPFHICSVRFGDYNAGTVEYRVANAVGDSTDRASETDPYNSAALTTAIRQIEVTETANQISLTTSEFNLQPDDLFDSLGASNVGRVGIKTQVKMFAKITAANFANVTTVANASWSYDKVVDMRALADAKYWGDKRALVLPPAAVAYLRKDATFKAQIGYGVNPSLTDETDRPDSYVGYCEGFDIYSSTELPSASGADFNGFMCTPDALGLGIVPIKPDANEPYEVTTVTIPSQKFAMRQEKGKSGLNNVRFLRHIQWNGFAVGNNEALYRIKTNA
jgi:hypothetical protein